MEEDIKKYDEPLIRKVTCKKCGKEHDFIMYPIINFSNKELTEKTFSLELFQFECPNCNAKTLIQYDTIIIDMFKKNLIYLFSNEDINEFYTNIRPKLASILESSEEIKNNIKDLKHTRLVTSLNELLEKLLIFDYDLDDRVVELMKYSLFSHKELQEFECIKLFFDKLEKDKLLFTCISRNDTKPPKGIAIDIQGYNHIIDNAKIIPELPNIDFNRINEKWIQTVIKENNNN